MEYINPDIIGVATEEEKLTTFAKNNLLPTSFLASSLPKKIQKNTDAIVYGLTGDTLDADLEVTEGHKHNDNRSQLRWKQIASYNFVNFHSSISEAVRLDSTSETNLAVFNLWIPSDYITSVVCRIRVSSAGSSNVLATFRIKFNESDYSTDYTKEILLTTHRAYDNEWIETEGIDINGMPSDVDIAGFYPVIVQLTGFLSSLSEFVSLHEISFGIWSA